MVTLGCDKNTVDSERYIAQLESYGATFTRDADDANVILVNTCGFIDEAKKESIDTLLEASRHKDAGQCQAVVALGCMVERHRDELRDALPEVDHFLGASEGDRLIPMLREWGLLDATPMLAHPGVRVHAGDMPHLRYLKISEGCDHGCAFCAIPLMRGRHRSFSIDDLVREAQLLEAQGAREVNLVAQDLAHYGRDVRDGRGLAELLETLLRETGVPWYRLLYIYSAGLHQRMLELMAREPRILRYLDIPMQHASDRVLERMRRPERQARQRQTIRAIRSILPDVTIRTTVIVGFPGETEDDVLQLLEFLEDVQLDRVGVFTYSAQEGTRAFDLPDDVPEEVKRDRLARVMEVQRLITADRYDRAIGTTVRALVDRSSDADGIAVARTAVQAEDVDGVTFVRTSARAGSFLDVRLDDVVEDFDFVATEVARVDEVRAPPRLRTLPIAGSSIGTYGR
ncbi:MAG: Ribosomal protein S12 methylthiotransferase RimO [Gemmatimonadaceae bacterium]|nr:Ribosomal protein S12 methylthiotransferase RimO [Gemmatimonadaceae bacterium]